jgi:Uma2 family endonuclease
MRRQLDRAASSDQQGSRMSVSSTRLRTTENPAKSAAIGERQRLPRSERLPPYSVRRFTVAEYEAMARAGILDEDSNVELLEGWIVPKMTKYPPHDSTIDRLAYLLNQLLAPGWYVRVQNAIVTADSEPEPDVVVVRGIPGDYSDRHPGGADIGLIIEVADSTVARDRRKAKIYAHAGVPHYWIVNLDDRQIEIYTQPFSKGKRAVYQSRQIFLSPDDVGVVVLDATEVGRLRVADMLPPQRKIAGGK